MLGNYQICSVCMLPKDTANVELPQMYLGAGTRQLYWAGAPDILNPKPKNHKNKYNASP